MNGMDVVDALMAQMTLAEKIGQLNLLAAGEGLLTGASQPSALSHRLDAGQVGAIFGTKSLATATSSQLPTAAVPALGKVPACRNHADTAGAGTRYAKIRNKAVDVALVVFCHT